LPEDEQVHSEPASFILHHAPAQPEGYVGDDDIEDDEEEDLDKDPKEEPIEQVVPEPNNMDGFAPYLLPQPEGNMNGWLIKDDDEELEEDKVGDDGDEDLEEDGVGDNGDEELEKDRVGDDDDEEMDMDENNKDNDG
ncbi:hypothetical protein Tco_1425830, partial [Tanacetum coccineum]